MLLGKKEKNLCLLLRGTETDDQAETPSLLKLKVLRSRVWTPGPHEGMLAAKLLSSSPAGPVSAVSKFLAVPAKGKFVLASLLPWIYIAFGGS